MSTQSLTKRVASYTVEIVLEDGNYIVTVPSLSGCHTWGKTLAAAECNAKEAIEGFIETLRKQGKPIPVDRRKVMLRVQKKVNVAV